MPTLNPSLTKWNLTKVLRSSPKLSAAEARALVNAFLKTITTQLVEGEGVNLSELSRFESHFSPAHAPTVTQPHRSTGSNSRPAAICLYLKPKFA
ncbi:MAG: hypothetical protein AMR96_06630 [Candidatus Adiutrix intracellularis]|jgi:nucleoid DNA-binding protein|nr:MAG: hypothetical protein AMR96_06630 [Candidatus Adiutrix intracellularis]MDR2827112.1 HU family DNA-binding protein [Candidatus Adiutrix intracellularis]